MAKTPKNMNHLLIKNNYLLIVSFHHPVFSSIIFTEAIVPIGSWRVAECHAPKTKQHKTYEKNKKIM